MRLHARITVLEQENADKKAVLERRKNGLSGKRRVIDGKHLMTGRSWLVWRKREEVTKQRKAAPKGKQKRNTKRKVKKESSDESEADSYNTDDGEIEILECIEIKGSR